MEKTEDLLRDIENFDIVLPEFQREYVWEKEQSKQLIVSLYKDYPTGSLLFWKTKEPIEIKNMKIPEQKLGTIKVILDGQQRLTTLYLLIKNKIPPFYKENEITKDPRNLYFNINSGEFQYFMKSLMEKDPYWISVTNCFNEEINVFKVASEKEQDHEERFKLSEHLTKNLTKLRNIKEKLYPIQTVPDSARIDEAIDVFDRVNSLGTKLSDAELALAHMCGKWPQARKVFKAKIAELKKHQFSFGLDFIVRCITGMTRKRALFETVHKATEAELKSVWKRLERVLDYLVNILRNHAFIHSTEDLNTTNVLVPIVNYLAKYEGKFRNHIERNLLFHWMYSALNWSHYSGQVDQKLDKDISIIYQEDNPYEALINEIVQERGRIEVKPFDLEGRGVQNPLYKMMYFVSKSNGALDWFNGSPLSQPIGEAYSVHSHHIFPTSLLYKRGKYNSQNYLHKMIANEIANRAFLTQSTNLSISNQEPIHYLKKVQEKYPESLEKQFVPINPELWTIENYELFLSERRRLVANAINDFLDTLIKEPLVEEISILDLIRRDENDVLEFKSTLRWNIKDNKKDKEMEKSVMKTIAGFMNSKGGNLIIGIDDNKKIVGLDKDYETLWKKNRDGFELHLRNLLDSSIGKEFIHIIRIEFSDIENKNICRVEVGKSPKPIFISKDGEKEFFIRSGNSTKPLNQEETYKYIFMNWKY